MTRIFMLVTALMLSGCSGGTDTSAIGAGLASVALAMIIGAVIDKLPPNQKGDDDEP